MEDKFSIETVDVESINGETDMRKVLYQIMPELNHVKDYLVLDSKYRELNERGDDVIKKFTFNYVNTKNLQIGTVNSNRALENVLCIKLYSVCAPLGIETYDGSLSYMRLSVLIDEFAGQSYIMSDTMRAHWILRFAEYKYGNGQKRMEFNIEEFSDGMFWFNTKIRKLDNINIRFGSPIYPVTYKHDRDTAVLVSGASTDIITDYPHKFTNGSKTFISLSNLASNNILDHALVDILNNKEAWAATVIDANTLRIAFDTSALVGLVGKFNVFYEDRRIIMCLEVICEKSS